MTSLKEDISDLHERIRNIKESLSKNIMNLPDNHRVKRLSEKPSTFTVLPGDMLDCLDPFYHDFRSQYQYLALLVTRIDFWILDQVLKTICQNGKIRDRGVLYKFHPEVISRLRTFIE